jgi:hypothetical protein
MKQVLIILFLSLITYSAQSQVKNTLTIYSEIEEPFILTFNGEQMSEDYVTHLKFETFNTYITGTIKFKNSELPDLVNKYIPIAPEGEPSATVYKIYKKTKKKKGQLITIYKIGYVSRAKKTS